MLLKDIFQSVVIAICVRQVMKFKGLLMVMFRNQQCDEELLLINNKHKQNFTNSSSSQPELTTIFTNMILNRRVNI